MLRRLLDHPQAVRSLLENAVCEGPGGVALLHFGICKVRSKPKSLRRRPQWPVYHHLPACIIYVYLSHESPVQEWDYTVLLAADPLTRLLDLIDEVRLDN